MLQATGGREVAIDLMDIYRRRLTITDSALRRQRLAEKARIIESVRQHVWPLIEAGRFKAVVHRVSSLAEAASAHSLMESSEHIGEIVLRVA